MSDTVQLAKCFDDLVQGMVNGDPKIMDPVMSDSIELFHANGDKQTKKEWLEIVEKKVITYHSGETTYLEITINGNSAELKAKTRLDVTSPDHPRSTFEMAQTITAEKIDGKWKFTKCRPDSLK